MFFLCHFTTVFKCQYCKNYANCEYSYYFLSVLLALVSCFWYIADQLDSSPLPWCTFIIHKSTNMNLIFLFLSIVLYVHEISMHVQELNSFIFVHITVSNNCFDIWYIFVIETLALFAYTFFVNPHHLY